MSKRRRARVQARPPLWTEIELAFFAAAPPDDPPPPAEPEVFEDEQPAGSIWSALRRLFARRRSSPAQEPMRAARSSSLAA